ncbi:MAG: hypothetical protein NXI10_16715 [bacterium]|nr:hypothetical protein [bacterium]
MSTSKVVGRYKESAVPPTESRGTTSESTLPGLPPVEWKKHGLEAPELVSDKDWNPNKDQKMYPIDMIIMTWTSAEWAAFAQVMTGRTDTMPYNGYGGSDGPFWKDDWAAYYNYWDDNVLSAGSPSISNTAWGSCCVVKFPQNGKYALLFKSDMHISTDGPTIPLRNMVQQLINDFSPNLILTIGTAGGTSPSDDLGSANITNGGHCQLSGEFSGLNFWFNNTTFQSNWTPKTTYLSKAQDELSKVVPVTQDWINELYATKKDELIDTCTGKPYPLSALQNSNIGPSNIPVKLNNVANEQMVLTTNSYVVATTDGSYDKYAAMEMDDAVIGMVCNANKIDFGVVRNISDPVQNRELNQTAAGNWGSIIYSAFGFYSSYNGALATWAIAAAE